MAEVGDPGDARSAGDPGIAPRRRRRWPRVLLSLGLAVVLVAGAASIGVGALLKRLEGNVTTIQGLETTTEESQSYEALNFLVMGSDSREGDNSSFGDAGDIGGQRSDTTILVHLAADRQSALAVSIPRDTYVTMPKCASQSGDWEVSGKFNSAFTFGGPACTTQTVKRITGLPIHHVVVVDFTGFEQVVDAMGGVDICLEEATVDPLSNLDLPAGWSTVDGEQALAFVRTRSALGDGSDISRIQRQQEFMAAAIQQGTDRSLLANPVKLYSILDAATSSLSVDEGLNELSEMTELANSVRSLSPADISFVTMPFVYANDGSNVLINERRAAEIWNAMATDQPWPPKPKAPAEGERPLTVAPGDISVRVLNGNGIDNAATDASQDLSDVGFVIAGLATADRSTYKYTKVTFHPDDRQAARTLAVSTGARLEVDDTQWPGSVNLIVGRDYDGASRVVVARQPTGTSDDPQPITADTTVCSS